MSEQVSLDSSIVAKARRLADAKQISVEDLFATLVTREEEAERNVSSLIGAMADDSELLDEIVESANVARETHSFRLGTDG